MPQPLTRPTEDGDDPAYGDEALAETTSISSWIRDYRVENGRTYHALKDGKYCQDLYRKTLNNRLFLESKMAWTSCSGTSNSAPLRWSARRKKISADAERGLDLDLEFDLNSTGGGGSGFSIWQVKSPQSRHSSTRDAELKVNERDVTDVFDLPTTPQLERRPWWTSDSGRYTACNLVSTVASQRLTVNSVAVVLPLMIVVVTIRTHVPVHWATRD
ncbi:hypothetical protein Z517_09313 [Fonsecaea pedrosoi CBS 271.37]|uniref:Uncharacterized protein n=1 Tax=Fonsecaea pedrosoi CBS 271.37 TaxID=1442368 RepID=A0A0D2GWZ0_9EURO|nr:uncharacterized protein Z517_09313 [Fonsecaea pedrosoi CBS 271.37]KIW76869.1 hypothetical protein Z517_09313 [Fonsecaea pedrosoi CBS 271.37]